MLYVIKIYVGHLNVSLRAGKTDELRHKMQPSDLTWWSPSLMTIKDAGDRERDKLIV